MKLSVAAVAILTTVLCCCSNVRAQDCTDETAMQQKQEMCFSKAGLSLDGTKADQFHAIIQKDPVQFCKNLNQFKPAMRCSLQLAEGCLQQQGQGVDMMPDVDKMIKGVTNMCNHIEVIDQTCLQSKMSKIFDCGKEKGGEFAKQGADAKTTICQVYKIGAECFAQELRPCGCKMTEIFVSMSRDSMTPPGCPKLDQPVVKCSADGTEFVDGTGGSAAWGATFSLLSFALLLAAFPFLH